MEVAHQVADHVASDLVVLGERVSLDDGEFPMIQRFEIGPQGLGVLGVGRAEVTDRGVSPAEETVQEPQAREPSTAEPDAALPAGTAAEALRTSQQEDQQEEQQAAEQPVEQQPVAVREPAPDRVQPAVPSTEERTPSAGAAGTERSAVDAAEPDLPATPSFRERRITEFGDDELTFVFSEAKADLTRSAQGRPVDSTGYAAANIAYDQIHRSSDRCIGAIVAA